MRKILILVLILTVVAAWAQDSQEEAIILNQEMDFLRSDAETPEVFLPQQAAATPTPRARAADITADKNVDLEQFFFGEDSVQTKAAGPRRRAIED